MDKVKNQLTVEVSGKNFVDEGDGVVSFPNGLTITDGTVQRNGTQYDIDSLDISKYGGQLTGDHEDKLSSLIGETIGVEKKDGKVVVNKIRYAIKENPYARIAYNLLVGGFSKNFSTETIGPKPDINTGVYWNAELTGLSQVVTQNNYNAHVNEFNEVVHNSLEQSKKDGLDVDGIEEKVTSNNSVEKEQKMEENTNKDAETKTEEVITDTDVEAKTDDTTVTDSVADVDESTEKTKTESTEEEKTEEVEKTENKSEKSATKVKKSENGTWVETTTTTTTREYVETEEEIAERKAREARWDRETEARIEADKAPDTVVVVVESDNEATEKTQNKTNETETAENDVDDTTEEAVEEKETNKKDEKMDENKSENSTVTLSKEELQELFANAIAPVTKELAEVRAEAKNAFDASAKEPEFKDEEEAKEEAANDYKSMNWQDRYQIQVNAAWDAVKNNSIVAQQKLRDINEVNLNALKTAGIARNSITLDDLGNFVIPPEMYNEIVGKRNDYTAIIDVTEWKETLSLEFAWAKRVGDIDMKNVAIGSTIVDGEPAASDDARLKPISEYATVPQKSTLEELAAITVVATSTTRFAAVDLLSDAAAGYRTDYDRKRAQLVIAKLEDAVDETGNSIAYNPSSDTDALTVWLTAITEISDTTLNGTLVFNARTYAELKKRAVSAGVSGPLSEILITGDVPTIFGYRFVVVPNDLMPTLGGSESIAHEVNGVPKVINHAVYFADLSTFTGRTSGGLQYDISNSASYEVGGGVVRSAYQRNELVLRGSFYRGGAVRDVNVVAGIRQGSGGNVS